MLNRAIFLLSFCVPWLFRRRLLNVLLNWEIDATAKIGYSWVLPKRLKMGPGARIGHGTFIKGLTELQLGAHARIGNLNWITGFPEGTSSSHFADDSARRPCLIVHEHAAITNRHLIDCTNLVTIGAFATFAGFRSQILTHSVSISEGRQKSRPVSIGAYSFVGTMCVLLPGSSVSNCSVVAAGSVVNRCWTESHLLLGGVPAAAVRKFEGSEAYFNREQGYIL